MDPLRWTTVDESMPEQRRVSPGEMDSAVVLVTDGESVDLASWYTDEDYRDAPMWYCQNDRELSWEPSHWQPLPPLPTIGG